MTAFAPQSASPTRGFRAVIRILLPLVAMIAITAQPAMAQSILRDAETEALFQDMMDPLLVAAGLQPGQVRVHLLGDRSINAFVAGSQDIYVFSGLVEAADGSADGRGKLLALSRHASPAPEICGAFSADDLSLALGLENAIHAVLLAGGRADRWTLEVERLAGFRPLRPPHWDISGEADGTAGTLPTGAN